jgi:hypothetical protein
MRELRNRHAIVMLRHRCVYVVSMLREDVVQIRKDYRMFKALLNAEPAEVVVNLGLPGFATFRRTLGLEVVTQQEKILQNISGPARLHDG